MVISYQHYDSQITWLVVIHNQVVANKYHHNQRMYAYGSS